MLAPWIICADVLAGLLQIPAETVQCAITSPPYWRLRQYAGVQPTAWADGQTVCLGAELDPDAFVRHLVQVFAELRRVLRADGVLFVNLGETYNAGRNGGHAGGKQQWKDERYFAASGANVHRLEAGDRCGIPERFALAMQADGWIWRDLITWCKRSPMPMSRSGWRWQRCRVKVGASTRANGRKADAIPHKPQGGYADDGRSFAPGAIWAPCPGCKKCRHNGGWILRRGRFCTTGATEPIFMFTKGKHYFCDSEAASEPATYTGHKRGAAKGEFASKGEPLPGREPFRAMTATRLPRSFFLLSNEPKREKHFAAYPSEIPRRLIEMATSSAGCCSACGTPLAPMVESDRMPTRSGDSSKCEGNHEAEGNRDPERHVTETRVIGYRPACSCGADVKPCTVLDPFAGLGTTLRAARHLGRRSIGIEASPQYVALLEANVERPLPARGQAKPAAKPRPSPSDRQRELFTDLHEAS